MSAVSKAIQQARAINPAINAKCRESVVTSRAREARYQRRPGMCWAYVGKCAKLRGRFATCHDSSQPEKCAAAGGAGR